MRENIETGALGEKLAAEYYEANGYKVVARNYRAAHDEIDFIAEDNRCVVFVEVKTRTSYQEAFRPSVAVNRKKRICLVRAAQTYMRTHNSEKFHRFDVVEVVLHENETDKINIIKNAFGADGSVI